MTARPGGLGKGLSALLKDTKTPTAINRDLTQELPLNLIKPNRYQPRQEFDESAMEDMVASIKSYGILQPILVRELPNGGYELIAGERRMRAAKLAGLEKIPALIRAYNDREISAIALVENLQREDLNIIEESKAYDRLLKDFSLTQEELAKAIGRSRSHIANILRLLQLAPKVQDYLQNGNLSMGQAKPLLALDENLQVEAADIIQAQELSARQAERLVKRLKAEPGKISAPTVKEELFLQEAEEKLQRLFGTPVKIKSGSKKSHIEIEFYSDDDLDRIMSLVAPAGDELKRRQIEALRKVSLSQNFTV